ncbi:hypothetical protein B0F87_11727 [Methylobacter tundripaludum]|uniref:Uncharacterized protein n=1 Tax=Methylobacter tundripaludum TaxID=173365 RepID=A0A2S6H505_9GAMM|nr:hypothetical protein B0F87_11727 [Methylobacter tundripaludum]
MQEQLPRHEEHEVFYFAFLRVLHVFVVMLLLGYSVTPFTMRLP